MSIECIQSIFIKRVSEAIPPFEIRYSLFDILRFAFPLFCGSLPGLAEAHTRCQEVAVRKTKTCFMTFEPPAI